MLFVPLELVFPALDLRVWHPHPNNTFDYDIEVLTNVTMSEYDIIFCFHNKFETLNQIIHSFLCYLALFSKEFILFYNFYHFVDFLFGPSVCRLLKDLFDF